jgi:VWFA-related protein
VLHFNLRSALRGAAPLALSLAAALPLLSGASMTAAPAQQSTFRAAVDLIAVDVQVVDADGRPISTLDRERFEVTIDGRKRRVASADLIQNSIAAAGGTRPLGSGPVASNAWPVSGEDGRTFVLAVDASSFEAGDALPVVQAARRFVDRLQASVRVGVFTLPPIGPHVDPTTDRAKVRQALDRVAGQRQSLPGQFNLSTSEIIDISAETSGLGTPGAASAAAAQAAATGARGAPIPVVGETNTLQRVQVRECRRTGDTGCIESIISEAAALASYLEERATQSLNGIAALLDALRTYPGRKTVVVLSGGMAVSDRPGGRVDVGNEATQLGEQAAHANATIYALHVDTGMSHTYSAQSRRARDSVSLERERRLSSRLLDEFAGASGGALLSVLVGAGDIALDRVLRETSAYYLLGVEPANMDRDGRAHRLQVKVSQRGATVRSRQWVVLRAAGH